MQTNYSNRKSQDRTCQASTSEKKRMRQFELGKGLIFEFQNYAVVIRTEDESFFSVSCNLSDNELVGLVMFVGESSDFVRKFCPVSGRPDFAKKLSYALDMAIDSAQENFLLSFTCACTTVKVQVDDRRLFEFAAFLRECLLDKMRGP